MGEMDEFDLTYLRYTFPEDLVCNPVSESADGRYSEEENAFAAMAGISDPFRQFDAIRRLRSRLNNLSHLAVINMSAAKQETRKE